MESYQQSTTSRHVVVDVRTPAEFTSGHVPGSLNIPLQEIPGRAEELRSLGRPIILCCASGNRSGQATQYLSAIGLSEVYNAGSWLDVNQFLQSKKF